MLSDMPCKLPPSQARDQRPVISPLQALTFGSTFPCLDARASIPPLSSSTSSPCLMRSNSTSEPVVVVEIGSLAGVEVAEAGEGWGG